MLEIIETTDNEAASYHTNIKGWVDRHGNLFDDEETARYSGATHKRCKNCYQLVEKSYVFCKVCQDAIQFERYNKMEKVKWDGETPLYSEKYDVYFYSIDNIINYANDHISEFDFTTYDDMRPVLCVEVELHKIPIDYWEDMYDYSDNKELEDAINDFNLVLGDIKTNCWEPSDYRVSIDNYLRDKTK